MISRAEQLIYLQDLIVTLSDAELTLGRLAETDAAAADVRDAVGTALATAYFFAADRQFATVGQLSRVRMS